MPTFPERLKAAMTEAGVNQNALAKASGRPQSGISQYLSGQKEPTTEVVFSLEDALGLPHGHLLGIKTNLAELPLGQIDVSPFQARNLIADDTIQELAASVQERGILQPIRVRVPPSDCTVDVVPSLMQTGHFIAVSYDLRAA